jgi:hypothetical protein
VELEGRQPIFNTEPHLAWHSNEFHQKEWFLLEEYGNRVAVYQWITGVDKPHKMCGSVNSFPE